MPTKAKVLSDTQEKIIRDTQDKLTRLETVRDIINPATFKASQRDILRTLIRRVLFESYQILS